MMFKRGGKTVTGVMVKNDGYENHTQQHKQYPSNLYIPEYSVGQRPDKGKN